MSKKRIFLISLAAMAVLALGGAAVAGYTAANRYRLRVEYDYKRAMNDLNVSVDNMETALNKAVYANTPTEQNGLAAKLMRESSVAKAASAVLPTSENSLSNVNKFITQVGDFSMALSNKISAGQKISEKEYGTMKQLEQYAKTLKKDLLDFNPDIGSAEIAQEFDQTSEDFTDFPSLIYDGPFSDHVLQMKARLTQGKSEIAQGNAQNIAADFLRTTQDRLEHTQDTAGNMPTYNFTANSGAIRVCVTKAGGYVATMQNSRDVVQENLDYAAALKKAEAFLSGRGIGDMKPSYYVINDGICTVNFASVQDRVVCYPDLIKVSVALDNGDIVGFNSTGYIMNHRDRTFSPKLTQAQAQKSVSSHLKVQKGCMALIPTPGLNEVLCYEFLCSGQNGDQVLVYIDAADGYEEQILILQHSDNGVLTE
jgi:germination protein YpeB